MTKMDFADAVSSVLVEARSATAAHQIGPSELASICVFWLSQCPKIFTSVVLQPDLEVLIILLIVAHIQRFLCRPGGDS